MHPPLTGDMICTLVAGGRSPPFFLRLTKETCKEQDDERTDTINGRVTPTTREDKELALLGQGEPGDGRRLRLGVRRGPAGLPRAGGGCGILRVARRGRLPTRKVLLQAGARRAAP